MHRSQLLTQFYADNEVMDTAKLSDKKNSIALRSLYYWTKCLGINPLSLSNNGVLEFTYIGVFYGYLLGTIYCYIFHLTLKERLTFLLPGETPISVIVDFMGICWQFLETLSTWLIFANFQNRIKLIVESFVRSERTSTKLGIPDDYEKRFGEIVLNLTIVNFVFLASLIFSDEIWSQWDIVNSPLWLCFNVPTLATFNMSMLFLWCLILVKRKFKLLNVKVRVLMENWSFEGREIKNESRRSKRRSSCNPDSLSDRISMISQLHRELRDVICRIEEHFSLPILLTIGNNFTYITYHVYALYRYLKSSEELKITTGLLYIGAIWHLTIYPFTMILTISNICGSTVDEANNTGNLLHDMLNNCDIHNPKRKNLRLNVLSLDLLHNKLSISLFGLFKLDHYLIYGTLTTVTAYVTIMLQLYT